MYVSLAVSFFWRRWSDRSVVEGWNSWLSCRTLPSKWMLKLHFTDGNARQRGRLPLIFLKVKISVVWICVQDLQILIPCSMMWISRKRSGMTQSPSKTLPSIKSAPLDDFNLLPQSVSNNTINSMVWFIVRPVQGYWQKFGKGKILASSKNMRSATDIFSKNLKTLCIRRVQFSCYRIHWISSLIFSWTLFMIFGLILFLRTSCFLPC